jgi:hypothetical protein
MAVIENLGLAVSVVIDGTAAQEYDDPQAVLEHEGEKIDPTVTAVCNKYIMAEDETEYLVRLEVLPQNTWVGLNKKNTVVFQVHIDGKWRRGASFRSKILKNGYREKDLDGTKTYDSNGWSMRKFSFGTITASEHSYSIFLKEILTVHTS